MAGHSQFKNIMHRKGAQDAKKGKRFTKIQREITSAAKSGLPDPASNPRLRSAIQLARVENMPKDKIEAAIKRATGAGVGEDYQNVRYEGYGAGGVAVIVEALTDNRNRTAGEIRSIFTKYSGNMGETGSVGFMFDHVGLIVYPAAKAAEDAMMEAAIDVGADDCKSNKDAHEIFCTVENFGAVRDGLEAKFGLPESAKLAWIAKVMAPVSIEQAQLIMKLVDALDDSDDVQEVFTNLEASEEVLAKLGAA